MNTIQKIVRFAIVFFALLIDAQYLWQPAPDSTSKIIEAKSASLSSVVPPPEYLTINGERWYLWPYDYRKDKTNTEGETDCSRRDIWYDTDPKINQACLRTIVWHEIIHAGFCHLKDVHQSNWSDFTDDMPEHEGVYELGMFLPGFVHDNPEFMRWAENWESK